MTDQPVPAPDVSVQRQVLALPEDLKAKRGIAMPFMTHDLTVAAQMCDRVAVLRFGEIIEMRPVDAPFPAPSETSTRDLLAAVPGQARRTGR